MGRVEERGGRKQSEGVCRWIIMQSEDWRQRARASRMSLQDEGMVARVRVCGVVPLLALWFALLAVFIRAMR